MRPLRTAAVALATIVAATAGCGTASPKPPPVPTVAPPSAVSAAVHAGNSLAVGLLSRLGQSGGNVVFSPYSIETALAMVGTGAAGSTASQIEHVLDTTRPAAVASGLASIGLGLTARSPLHDAPRIELANGLWVQSGFPLSSAFTRTLGTVFGAPAQIADFAGAPEAARRRINAWVAARTAHLIANLFPGGTITAHTALVLANAIHLSARWANPFTRSDTALAPFHTGDGAAAEVPFMTQTSVELPYRRRRAFQAIDLPYLHSDLSMLVVMPAPGTLTQFERSLGAGSEAAIGRSLVPTRLELRMPKFDLRFDAGLKPVLSALGMPVAFTDAADFSGITTQTSLKISAVQHAADLRVDEQGTVAAAATGIAIEPTAIALPPATVVTINHPFLVFLRDDTSGAILFVAQVTNPA